MKVLFKYGIGGMAGTIDEGVYRFTTNKTGSIMRKYTYPRLTSNNKLRGSIMKNMATVWNSVSSSYKDDMKVYCAIWNTTYKDTNDPFSPERSSFAMFLDMMYLFSELDSGHVDLSTVTYTDLLTVGADIVNIHTAITNGYLQPVSGSDHLNGNM